MEPTAVRKPAVASWLFSSTPRDATGKPPIANHRKRGPSPPYRKCDGGFLRPAACRRRKRTPSPACERRHLMVRPSVCGPGKVLRAQLIFCGTEYRPSIPVYCAQRQRLARYESIQGLQPRRGNHMATPWRQGYRWQLFRPGPGRTNQSRLRCALLVRKSVTV
jgi:hypothetical protein